MKVILSSTSVVGAAACLFVFFALSTATAAAQQIYETPNDPSSLCIDDNSIKLTGYKATKDCRGYVYCNEGYLMGGGIIPCWPNQLFDESAQACTYWQNVDTSNCPEFDGSKLMPDQYDDNANEERFFCGQSWTHAKSICEPCPGGSRLECSTLGHTCFAGVTGCPTSSNTNAASSNNHSGDNNSSSNNNSGMNSNSQPIIQGQPQPHPAIVFVEPNTPSNTATASFEEVNNDNNNAANKECTTHSDCPSNKFCNEGYCGQCSKEGIGCSVDQVCRTASCHVTQTPGPGKCYEKEELHSFCAVAWKDERYQCNLDLMVCENSNLSLGGGDSPVAQEVATPTQDTATSIVTKPESTNTNSPPLYTNPTGNNYFCGYNFATLTSACLQSKPCPHGFASKVCDDTEGCFRSDQCADEYEAAAASTASSSASSVSSSTSNQNTAATTTTTNQQQQQQQQHPTGSSEGLSQEVFTNTPPSSQAVVVTSPESPSNSWINGINKQCTSHDDCTTGQFCNEGYCGECSKEGIGCSVDQVCRTASCHVTQNPGPGKCYLKEELHSFCRNARKDESYQCNLDLMVCLPTQVTVDTQTLSSKDPSPPSSSSSSSSLVSVISTSTEATTSPPSSQPTNTPSKASSTPRPTNANAQTNKCSICGDLQVLDSDATIFYEGTELSCAELEDKVFIEDDITMGSDICLTSRELYSATCCIDPPQDPCNLCRSGDNNFPLKSNVKVVSMTGETQSCLEVSQSLLARREQSSWQCRSSQKELQAKCCDGTTFDDNNTDESLTLEDYNNVPVPTPGVNWSPLGGDEPAAAGYPSEGFYYAKPDWNWKEEWDSSGRRISSTTSAIALFSIMVGGLLWQ